MTGEKRGRSDLLVAGILALAVAVLYRLTAQERFSNDGPQLASVFALVPDSVHWQVLYLPVARAVGRLVSFGDVFEPLRLLSAVGGGLGVGTSYLLTRGFGVARRFALGAALTVAVSRYAWFFGSSVEVHAVHFGVVGLAACATFFAPWRRPALALSIAALSLALAWISHGTAVLLGPGWVALCGLARARVADPFRPRTLLLVVGPVLLGALLLVMVPVKTWWVATTGGSSDLEWNIIVSYARNADRLEFLLAGLWRPLGLSSLLVVLGLAIGARKPAGRTLLVLLLPPTLFFVWWAVPEDGGYFLGHAPFHAVAIGWALALLSRRSLILVPGLIFLQGISSWASIRHFDRTLHPDERADLVVEEVGEVAWVGKIAYMAPDLTLWLPQITEVDLTGRLHQGFYAGRSATELAESVAFIVDQALDVSAVALDVSYAQERWGLAGAEFLAFVDEFVTALLGRFEVQRVSRGGWTLAVLRRPG